MDLPELVGYALGTAFVLAVAAAVAGLVVLAVGTVPLVLALFPLTAGLVAAVLLVGYLRHRRRRHPPRR